MRIGGIASGLDTNQMVKDLMKAERIPLDRLFQRRQTLDWQRDAFRDINLSLSKFRDSYSKMRLQSTFNAYGSSSSNVSVLTGQASVSAVPGTYDVIVQKLAKVATLNSDAPIRNLNASHAVTGTGPLTADASATRAITVDVANIAHNDVLTIDGEDIEFYNSGTGGPATGAIHQIDINGLSNDQVASAIAALNLSNVALTSNLNEVTITAAPGAAGNSIGTSYNGGASGIVNATGNLTGGTDLGTITVSSIPKAGDVLTINGEKVDFYDSANGAYSGSNHSIDISGKTTTQVADSIRVLPIAGVTLGGSAEQVAITSPNTGVSSSYSSNDRVTDTTKVLQAGQTENFTITNKQGLTANIEVTDQDTYATLAKKINDAKDVDGNTLGMRASFDNATSRFFISSREMGVDQGFTLENTAFVENQILGGGVVYSAVGQDAQLTFDGILVENQTSNNVTVHGINLNLLAESAEVVKMAVKSDTDGAFNTIKDFVESYNELIANLEAKINEPRYRDYPPLTDEERGAISEREAELWDEKAQSGLLRNDPQLRTTLNQLRRSLGDPVSGIATGELSILSQIGIKTGNYRDGGKLFIDENKLKASLNEKPDEVMNLFTKKATEEGNTSQMGLGMRTYEDINRAISNLRTKAGSSGMTVGDQSFLGKRLSRLDNQIFSREDRLLQVEDRYYRQFTAMEKAIAQMNQQSDFIMQSMFGDMQ